MATTATSPTTAPAEEDRNFLTVTDPLTNKSIKIPISHQGTIPASAFTGIRIKQTTPPAIIETDTVPLRLYDPGFKNTVVCRSKVSEVDGENGKLYYRGYDVEELVEKSNYLEVAYLLINGDLPSKDEFDNWNRSVMLHTYIHTEIERQMLTFRYDAHPMGMLISTIASLSTFHPDANPALQGDGLYMLPKIKAAQGARTKAIVRMLGKVPTIAANAYRHRIGREYNQPSPGCLNYTENLLYMIDKLNEPDYKPDQRLVKILDKVFILLAEHGSNCSTVMMRHLASSGVDPYTALSGSAGALFGERKASAVIGMLRQIGKVENIQVFLSMVKRKQTITGSLSDPIVTPDVSMKTKTQRSRPTRLMGFGHRIYKTHDPRVRICKGLAMELFELMGKGEEAVLADEWFVKRGLFPNIDYWSAMVFHTLGFPPDMFPVLVCIPRVAGFIAHWQESLDDPEYKIYRPRQVYIGEHHRPFERVEPPTPFTAGSNPAKTVPDDTTVESTDDTTTDLEAVPYVSSDPVAARRRTKTFTSDAAALAQLAEMIRKEEDERAVPDAASPGDSVASRLAIGPVSSWIVKNFFSQGAVSALQTPPVPAVVVKEDDAATAAKKIEERLAKAQAEMKSLIEEQQRLAAQVSRKTSSGSSANVLSTSGTPNRAVSPTPPTAGNPALKAAASLGSQPDLLAGSRSPRVVARSVTNDKRK
ncbi:citrate synthase-like protein [Chytridium lagenaria]|nr:citrate synthase-like protein [Chytridium lagenaria]